MFSLQRLMKTFYKKRPTFPLLMAVLNPSSQDQHYWQYPVGLVGKSNKYFTLNRNVSERMTLCFRNDCPYHTILPLNLCTSYVSSSLIKEGVCLCKLCVFKERIGGEVLRKTCKQNELRDHHEKKEEKRHLLKYWPIITQ